MGNAFNSSSSFQPNYFSILSARDTIQTLKCSQDIQLFPNGSAFSNINPILKYDSLIFMNEEPAE